MLIDRSAAARPHRRDRLLQQDEGRPQVHGHDGVPARHGDVLEVAASGVGGVVDEDVEAAESFHGEADQRAADLFARQVAVEVLRLASGRLDASDGLEAVGAIAAVHDDVRPETARNAPRCRGRCRRSSR